MSESNRKRRVMVGALEDCVHNMGVENFADWMEDKGLGYVAVKLGPAVPIAEVVHKIREARPEVVGVSMRLGDLHIERIVREFVLCCHENEVAPAHSSTRYAFGGLRPAANVVRAMTGLEPLPDKFTPDEEKKHDLGQIAAQYAGDERFHQFFDLIVDDAVEMDTLEQFAEGRDRRARAVPQWSDHLVERIRQVREYENRPVLRAHIGIAAESIEPTIQAVEHLADAGALEIISLAQDQVAQEMLVKFVRGEEDPEKHLKGQGGCPIRSVADLRRLKQTSQRGNFPTTRIYSGTDDFMGMAQLWEEHLNAAFPAVPLYFYSKLDGRGPVSIREAFREHLDVIRWWAQVPKPVEINDPHQWSLRNASDDQCVLDHVICGVVALKCGVKHYIQQMMFDLPPGLSAKMDLAKFKAAYELIEPLTRHFDFNIIKETRGGLNSFPPNLYHAKGHLAYSTRVQMFMEPDIVHVVSFPEAHHEAHAEDIVESCDIVKWVIKDVQQEGNQEYIWLDPQIKARVAELKQSAMYSLLHLALMAGYEGKVSLQNFDDWAGAPDGYEAMLLDLIDEDNYPSGNCDLISPDNLDLSLQTGLCQAPQVTVPDRRYVMAGACRTRVVDGCCKTIEFNGKPVRNERERVDMVRALNPWYFDKQISRTNAVSFIRLDDDEMVAAERVRAFREQLGVQDVSNQKVLVVDFGSTFTKVGLFDSAHEQFELRYVPTTPGDLREGLANALGVLADCRSAGNWDALGRAMAQFDVRMPCSSAKGGLKVVTVSLVAEESGKAADLAALTAGAKLLGSYAGKLTAAQVTEIYTEVQPEMILLAGGVDYGGDTEAVIHNARLLAAGRTQATYARYGVPIIYAGTVDAREQVRDIFSQAGVDCRITDNVMPEVNEFHIEAVNEAIRDLFSTIIIRGKGFDVVEEYFDTRFIPTPKACMLGINLLSSGFGDEPGVGNLLALDIGGCTTDFYSNVSKHHLYHFPWPDQRRRNKRVIHRTPNDPLVFRRVEGKFGMSYNAENLMELARFRDGSMQRDMVNYLRSRYPGFRPDGRGWTQFFSGAGPKLEFNLAGYLGWLSRQPDNLPRTPEETTLRACIAQEIMRVATENNAGRVEETDTYFLQYGINFYNADCTTLLIGGTIYHKCRLGGPGPLEDLRLIAAGAQFRESEPFSLRPRGPVLLDADYLVSIVGGLYGRLDPEGALRMMKRRLRALNVAEPSRQAAGD